MDWCFDARVAGARATVEADIVAHLARRTGEGQSLELARRIVSDALKGLDRAPGRRLHRVRLDWQGREARLGLSPLPAGEALPGRAFAPGVRLATDVLPEPANSEFLWLQLGFLRPAEEDLDPVPGPVPQGSERNQFVAGVMALVRRQSGLTAPGAGVAATAGATAARLAEDRYRQARALHDEALDARQVAEAFIEYQREIGGDFFLVEASERRVVLGNRRCPFGEQVKSFPDTCRLTSAMIGSLAARAAGEAAVTLDERLALGDHQCRLTLELGGPAYPDTSHRYRYPPAGVAQEADPYRIQLTFRLPRDSVSVPLIRHLTRHALDEAGVTAAVADDVDVALTEACTNVIDHAYPTDAYDVTVSLGAIRCEILVADVGLGFDPAEVAAGRTAPHEVGRGHGLPLMQALMDDVRVVSGPDRGTVVHLVKHLQFDEGTPAQRVLREGPPAGAAGR